MIVVNLFSIDDNTVTFDTAFWVYYIIIKCYYPYPFGGKRLKSDNIKSKIRDVCVPIEKSFMAEGTNRNCNFALFRTKPKVWFWNKLEQTVRYTVLFFRIFFLYYDARLKRSTRVDDTPCGLTTSYIITIVFINLKRCQVWNIEFIQGKAISGFPCSRRIEVSLCRRIFKNELLLPFFPRALCNILHFR